MNVMWAYDLEENCTNEIRQRLRQKRTCYESLLCCSNVAFIEIHLHIAGSFFRFI